MTSTSTTLLSIYLALNRRYGDKSYIRSSPVLQLSLAPNSVSTIQTSNIYIKKRENLPMPSIARHESVIQALKDGTHHVLGININGQRVTPGSKIAKKCRYSITIYPNKHILPFLPYSNSLTN